ncbi:MAG: cobyric acid synthase [Methanocorpusculum sp.]|nr:cobyric acid synthase [Methanocorpusculum sp.]
MSLMILGTSSHVGKSIITAGICRILSNRGFSVAPFKSQNMSLNSYITEDGDEIGIAQAVQAFSARACPNVLMNPVLLKPKADSVSQIVLMGKPYKDISVSKYYRDTEFLLDKAVEAFNELSSRYDEIVVEGAGGAAEVNLYEKDIANILLAKKLRLPIILVADIERGGVFAQIYGTISLLPKDVRPLVKGIIINKFRGDKDLFDSGLKIIEELCKVPVLGVVPFTRLEIPDEDSLSLEDKIPTDSLIKIAVIRYSHIANFTDFSLLERAAHVEYVLPGTPLCDFDAVILPGTKNTVSDLKELIESKTAEEIIRCAEKGIPVIGICGGYQMMGESIFDNAIESDSVAEYKGLGLLPVRTEFLKYNKLTVQKTRTAEPVGPILSRMGTVHGYEIHSGVSKVFGQGCFTDEGAVSCGGIIFGTYLHGLFAESSAVDALMSYLCEVKDLPYSPVLHNGDPYEKLAAILEKNIDAEKIVELACSENQIDERRKHHNIENSDAKKQPLGKR